MLGAVFVGGGLNVVGCVVLTVGEMLGLRGWTRGECCILVGECSLVGCGVGERAALLECVLCCECCEVLRDWEW